MDLPPRFFMFLQRCISNKFWGKLNISGVDKFELFSYRSSCWQPMFRSMRLKYLWLSGRVAPFTHKNNTLKNRGEKQNYVELSRKGKNHVYFFFNNRLSSGPRALWGFCAVYTRIRNWWEVHCGKWSSTLDVDLVLLEVYLHFKESACNQFPN